MSADRIIYCLERLSDYRDFERLCSAMLADGDYPGIEPLAALVAEAVELDLAGGIAWKR